LTSKQHVVIFNSSIVKILILQSGPQISLEKSEISKQKKETTTDYSKVINFINISQIIVQIKFFLIILICLIACFYIYRGIEERAIYTNTLIQNTNNLIQPYLEHASLQAKANNFDQAQSIINKSKLLPNISSERFFTIGLLEWYFQYLSAEPVEKYDINLERQIFPVSSAISSEGKYIFIGTNSGQIIKYDLLAKKNVFSMTAYESQVKNFAIHPENR